MRMRAPPPFSLVKLVVLTCPDQLYRCISSRRDGHEHMLWAYEPIPSLHETPLP